MESNTSGVEAEASKVSSWEAKCRQLLGTIAVAETESARKDGQLQQLEQRLTHARAQLDVAERQVWCKCAALCCKFGASVVQVWCSVLQCVVVAERQVL